MEDTLSIQGFTLGDYTQQVIDALQQGYTMSLDNDKYPYSFGGGSYFAVFVKDYEGVEIPEAPVAVPVDSVNENVEATDTTQENLDKQPETTVKSNRQSRRSK